jgi:CheY-like chemotaxis protein
MTELAERARIEGCLASLRRYARASVGNQERADECVARALEAALAGGRTPDKARLYRALYRALLTTPAVPATTTAMSDAEMFAERVRGLDHEAKHALLLRRLERLDAEEAGAVMGLSADDVERRLAAALDRVRAQPRASVLIVEDNLLIAEHISTSVSDLGHDVAGVAATAEEAIAAARLRRPDLVLADVDLGGAASGIDAIARIRERDAVPAIYVTGFPERVRRTDHVEPALVVTKPFDDRLLRVAMAEALGPVRIAS